LYRFNLGDGDALGREASDAATGADGNTIARGGLLQEIATVPCETHRVFVLGGLQATRAREASDA
jgi:hypothetical protein